ncbi:unnamed protein product [Ectocarpus sp. 8 AP-2014]
MLQQLRMRIFLSTRGSRWLCSRPHCQQDRWYLDSYSTAAGDIDLVGASSFPGSSQNSCLPTTLIPPPSTWLMLPGSFSPSAGQPSQTKQCQAPSAKFLSDSLDITSAVDYCTIVP